MGVYIEGMEMPTSCGKCKLFDLSHAIGLFAPFGFCRVCGKEIFCLSRIADACPIIEVPEPHGRLGDLDKLNEEMRLFIRENMLSRDDARGLLETIADAPTIIPVSTE